MQVKFNRDQELSYDGINVKLYKQGEVYTASHAQERIVFEKAVYMGSATTFMGESEAKVEAKVARPKSRK
jgi:hypothetical protein